METDLPTWIQEKTKPVINIFVRGLIALVEDEAAGIDLSSLSEEERGKYVRQAAEKLLIKQRKH